jgi:hypothetical protein
MYPDVTFIIYHSGIEARRREGAYDPRSADLATCGPRDGAEWRRFRAVHGAGPG